MGSPAYCSTGPATTEEEAVHDELWQKWLGRAIRKMAPKFGAGEDQFVRGDWLTKKVPASKAFRQVDPEGCDILSKGKGA